MPPFLDHFSLVSRYYDRLFPVQDAGRLRELLQLPAAGRVLDLGGGTGQVAQALRGFVDEIVVLEESVGMLRQARLKGLPAVRGEAERLPFAQGAFARILVVDTFHHLRDQRQAAAELLRVLAPGGRLVIEEGDVEQTPVRLIALAEKLLLMRRVSRRIHLPPLLERHSAQPPSEALGTTTCKLTARQ